MLIHVHTFNVIIFFVMWQRYIAMCFSQRWNSCRSWSVFCWWRLSIITLFAIGTGCKQTYVTRTLCRSLQIRCADIDTDFSLPGKKQRNMAFIYARLTVVRSPFAKNGILIEILLTSLELPALLSERKEKRQTKPKHKSTTWTEKYTEDCGGSVERHR